MIISVKVSPGAKKTAIKRFENDILYVSVTAPPEKGKANEEVIELLAEELKLKKNQIQIISGTTGKLKRVRLPEDKARSLILQSSWRLPVGISGHPQSR